MGYREVFERLRNLADKEVGLGASAEEIEQAEKALGCRLPESYKAFLQEFGWASVGPYEFFGLGRDVPSFLHLAKEALSERRTWYIPSYLVPFYNDGAGNFHCFDTRHFDQGECPIVFWDHQLGPDQEPDAWAENFVAWLNEHIDWAIEWSSKQEEVGRNG